MVSLLELVYNILQDFLLKLNVFDKEKCGFSNVCRKSERRGPLLDESFMRNEGILRKIERRSAYADRRCGVLLQLPRSCPRMYFFRGLYNTAAMTSAMMVLGSI